MSSPTKEIYVIPVVTDEGEKFNVNKEAESLIFAALKIYRVLNSLHAVDMELLEPMLSDQDKTKLALQREKDLTEQKLQALYKTQYAVLNGPWSAAVSRQKMKPLNEQARQLNVKISELEAEIWS
ncbi:hypothetical protein [Paenibacillus maysiensis]|uniref:hypothetical protein n=1 Tax=Paenibacillus maysiensis TaxID=1155954 RepID=UPI0004729748|nr:hypothetical protein [Paenibacillus maysiensis]